MLLGMQQSPRAAEPIRIGLKQVIVWPAEYKSGEVVYPYEATRQ
jgi:hypothetical protein